MIYPFCLRAKSVVLKIFPHTDAKYFIIKWTSRVCPLYGYLNKFIRKFLMSVILFYVWQKKFPVFHFIFLPFQLENISGDDRKWNTGDLETKSE